MGTLLLFTAMYAVLFSLLRMCGAPPGVFLVIATYLTAIGLGQMLLFGGKMPRVASVVVGVVTATVLHLGFCVVMVGYEGLFSPEVWLALGCSAISVMAFSVPLSYAAGGMIAGVFLVVDRLRTGVWNPEEGGKASPPEPILAELVAEPRPGRAKPR